MNRTTLRWAIAAFTSFVSVLLMTLLIGNVVTSMILLNRFTIDAAVNDSDFISNSYEEFQVRSGHISMEYGAPSELIDPILTKQQFSSDVRKSIDASYRNSEPDISFAMQRNDLHVALKGFIQSEGLTYTDEVNAGIDELIQRIEQAYRSSATIPYFHLYQGLRQKYVDYAPYLYLGLFVLLFGSLVFLYKLLKRRSFLKTSVLLFASCGWTYILVPGFLLINGFYDRLAIRPMSIQRLIAIFARNTLLGFLGSGILLILISMLIDYILNRKRRHFNEAK